MPTQSNLTQPTPINKKMSLAVATALVIASLAFTHSHVDAVELRAPQSPTSVPTQTTGLPATSATIASAPRVDLSGARLNPSVLFAPPSIQVKQIEVKPNEFPPATADQYKIGFECTISVVPVQKDYSIFPRHTCFIDQPRTAAMNALNITRVDSWPSADGITTKIVLIADKKSAKNPNPGRIRTAFQLLHEATPTVSKPVLKDFVYADGLLKKVVG